MNCLVGVKDVADAVGEIVTYRDVSLIDRLLDVIEIKTQCELQPAQSRKLLQAPLASSDVPLLLIK